jgi:hypothetical protein
MIHGQWSAPRVAEVLGGVNGLALASDTHSCIISKRSMASLIAEKYEPP